jgi:penicillin amidase
MALGCHGAQRDERVPAVPPVSGTLAVEGLSAPVRIVRDTWGVPHIYASTQDDLFFAQGFVQAEDRLFQIDLWSRAAQGRLSEVLGANFVSRDAMTRRLQYRGDVDIDWASYSPETRAIASAFVRGINAWVEIAREHPSQEFVLAGWLPETWRPEDLLNRTDAFLASGGSADADVFRARLAAAVGPARARTLLGDLAPGAVPPSVDLATVTYQVGDALRQVGTPPFFAALQRLAGSNAWAVTGERSATGSPLLAADPHRLLANPALRYLVHLTAPGWNVAGATAPWLPGVAIGHNDRIAWGMTAFDADTADIYVERLNPDNSHQVQIDGRWQNTTVVSGMIWVKGRDKPVVFEREYTPHGVVIGTDRERHLAYALRWSGHEAGGAGELGALALDRAESAADLRDALSRWNMPPVEVVYAERDGGIGSQVAARVPVRRGWDGRLPAAGWQTGTDWTGWRTAEELPASNGRRAVAQRQRADAAGYVVSANGNRARTERLRTILASGSFSVGAFDRLQHDVRAWNAERLVPLLVRVRSQDSSVEAARQQLLAWDREVSAGSTTAALYVTWERILRRMLVEARMPRALVDEFTSLVPNMLVPALLTPSHVWFDGDAASNRDQLVLRALAAAVAELATPAAGRPPRLGALNQVLLAHPLAITDATRRLFNVGPFERSGYADTVMSTSARRPESATAASFAAIMDTADWDRSIVQNTPGQSESPASTHFSDLSKLWSEGKYFPLAFSEGAVMAATRSTLTLIPGRSAVAPANGK